MLALVVATGVSGEGRREILGMALGDAEPTDFWTGFLGSLRDRGLKVATDADPLGVTFVTSDAHAVLKAAVKAILPGTVWQRCRVHYAEVWIMPMLRSDPLRGGGSPRARAA
jgi:putative transposase